MIALGKKFVEIPPPPPPADNKIEPFRRRAEQAIKLDYSGAADASADGRLDPPKFNFDETSGQRRKGIRGC